MGLSDSIGLLFQIRGDSSSAVKSVEDFKKELKELEKAQKDALTPFQEWGRVAGLNAEQTQKFGQELNGVKVGALAVAAGVTALAAGVTAAGIALFNLTKNAADFGSQIFDAKEKTGLTAETLSAMKFAADQSGTSLETITAASAKFAKTIGDAANGSDEAKAKLDRLGVTSKDLDTALGQALATIAKVTPGTEQMAAAMDAFGRSGADLLPFIKSFDGDLDGLVKKAKELGVTITDEAAKAADEFGDQLDTLNAQLAGVGRTIGQELMPEFNKMAQDVSAWLQKNPGEVKAWGDALATILRRIAAGAREAAANWEGLKDIIDTFTSTDPAAVDAYLERVKKRDVIRQESANVAAGTDIRGQGNSPSDQPNDLTANLPFAGKPYNYDAKAAEEAAKEAEKRRKEREAAYKKDLDQQTRHYALLLKGESDFFKNDLQQWEDSFLKGETTKDRYREVALNNILSYGQKAQELLDKQRDVELKGKTGTEKENVLQEYKNASAALYNELQRQRADVEKTITGVVKKETDTRLKIEKDAAKASLDLAKARSDGQIQFLENEFQQKALTEMQYLKARQREEISILETQRNAEKEESKRAVLDEQITTKKLKHLNEIRELEQKQLDTLREIAQEEADNFREEEVRDAARKQRQYDEEQDAIKKRDQSRFDSIGGGVLGGLFGDLGTSVEDMLQPVQIMDELGKMLANTFQQVAQAVGTAVKAFVLFGSTGGSIRKFVAEVIASVAQMAAVQAVWELAQGFAMLALNFFWPDPKYAAAAAMHFQAAAVYGGIALVAVGVGRAVAGDSFKKQTAAGGAGAPGGGSSGGRSSANAGSQGQAYSSYGDEALIREQGRNAPAVTVTISDDSQFLGKMLKFHIQNNNEVRDMIRTVAAS